MTDAELEKDLSLLYQRRESREKNLRGAERHGAGGVKPVEVLEVPGFREERMPTARSWARGLVANGITRG